jgi:hypothetical protein
MEKQPNPAREKVLNVENRALNKERKNDHLIISIDLWGELKDKLEHRATTSGHSTETIIKQALEMHLKLQID